MRESMYLLTDHVVVRLVFKLIITTNENSWGNVFNNCFRVLEFHSKEL